MGDYISPYMYMLSVLAADPVHSNIRPYPPTKAMAAKKTIAVVGATGNQGSSVANTFLALPHWHVRALTRTPSSDASRSLAARGVEVVRGDLADPASLVEAFENAHAIFLNTEFWEV